MKKFKAFLCLLLVFVMIFAFAACAKDVADDSADKGGNSESSGKQEQKDNSGKIEASGGSDIQVDTNTEGKPDHIQEGTQLNIRLSADFVNCMSALSAEGGFMFENVYDGLIYPYRCSYGDIRGAIAESWEWSDDALTVVFKLREDVYFANGKQVTAQDFVDYWDYAGEKQVSYFAYFKSYEATDKFELTCVLNRVTPEFEALIAGDAIYSVVDMEAVAEYGEGGYDALIKGGCNAGPYNVVDRVIGESITLKANENYWCADRQPNIETVVFRVISDDNTALMAMQSGEIDYFNTTNMEIYYSFKDIDRISNITTAVGRSMNAFVNQKQCPLFQDVTVREALAHIVDWEGINTLLYDGAFKALTSMWPEESIDWVDYTDKYYFDQEYGLGMLEDAGYKPSDIKFELSDGPGNAALHVALQGQLIALGMDVTVKVQDDSAGQVDMQNGTWDSMMTWSGYNCDLVFRFFTKSYGDNAPQKCFWFDAYDKDLAAELDQLYYDAGNNSKTFEDLVAGYKKLTTALQDNYATYGGIQQYNLCPVIEGLTGFAFRGPNAYLHFYYAWNTDAE